MAKYICSLIRNTDQLIPADGDYHIIRFPFGSAESYDGHEMHQVSQPDGHTVGDWDSDPRSGLIWPRVAGWATLTANIHWKSGGYTELRDRFTRDPLDLSTGADSTATDHRVPSPGMQCFTKQHQLFVDPQTPIAFLAAHTDGVAREVVHAQFKMAIDSDVAQ